MNKLNELNKYIYEEYKQLPNREELSIPLLISSNDDYTNNLERRVLYIGQETNCWMNYDDSTYLPDVDAIEDKYFNFLKDGARNRDFWVFIRSVLELQREGLLSNVIWNNVFIAGKRRSMGHPETNDKLENLSMEYLLEITKIFNPEHIIFVCGPTNPYYRVVTKYLKEINSGLVYEYPTPDKLVINDDRVIWTYHPAYQNRIHKKDEVLIKVRSLVNNE